MSDEGGDYLDDMKEKGSRSGRARRSEVWLLLMEDLGAIIVASRSLTEGGEIEGRTGWFDKWRRREICDLCFHDGGADGGFRLSLWWFDRGDGNGGGQKGLW